MIRSRTIRQQDGGAEPEGGAAWREARGGTSRRAVLAGLTVLLAAAAVAAIWYSVTAVPRPAIAVNPPVSLGAATVTRGDVVARQEVAGTLGFAGSYQVVSQLPAGVLTAVPPTGAVITRGHTLFRVSGIATTLLYGDTPAYRAFTLGMSDGPDVHELNANLVALGMDPGHAIVPGDRFQWATQAAIQRWQAAQGLPVAEQTGTIAFGQVIFLPRALRVTQTAPPGSDAGPGMTVVTGTSARQVVTAQVTTDLEADVHAGDPVLVSLPGGAQVPGTVSAVGRVASTTAAGPAGQGQAGGTQAAPGSATVTVTVQLRVPPQDADLDQAPVQVAIVTQRSQNVLMVPVTALLARPGGGYQVRVVNGTSRRLVTVQPGLFDGLAGTAAISGPGIAAGDQVEVPAS
jgi:Putative peptidoglycan binding domain